MNFYSTLTYYVTFIGAILLGIPMIKIIIEELKEVNFRVFKLDRFMQIVLIVIMIIIISFIRYPIIPGIKDLPYMIKGEYETVTGEALNDSMARTKMSSHALDIKDDETGEIIPIDLYYQPRINKGDRFTINYLPNTGIGNVAGEGYFGE